MKSKTLVINVRVTSSEKEKLCENANCCGLSLSEYLRKAGLGKELKAAVSEKNYRLFRMLEQLKADVSVLEKDNIANGIENIINEMNK